MPSSPAQWDLQDEENIPSPFSKKAEKERDIESNRDPFDQFGDGKLWDALKRSNLVESTKPEDTPEDGELGTDGRRRFTLTSLSGSNLSVAQRSTVSLARALVKDTKVLI